MAEGHVWRVVSSVGDSTLYRCERCCSNMLINDKAGFGELERRGGECVKSCAACARFPYTCPAPARPNCEAWEPITENSPTIRVTKEGTLVAALCEQDRATLKRLEEGMKVLQEGTKSLQHEVAGLRKHLGMIAHE